MSKNRDAVICLQRFGIKGELIVNGKEYNKAMPPPHSLTDIEIAQISTYIYNTWTHKRGLVDIPETSAILRECPAN